MALRYQKGSLRQQKTKCGEVWVLRYFAIDPETGKKIEPTPIKVGRVRDFPSKAQAWTEVGRQNLHNQINTPTVTGAATFRQIASHYSSRELTPNSMFEKGDGTTYCYQHIIAHYLNKRWGEVSAISIKPTDIQAWLHSLSKDVKAEAGLDWPTLVKIRSVMNMVYCHAMREELIPAEIKYNPCRPAKLGGAKLRRTKSNYKATAVTPGQVFTILSLVPILERTMILLVAATALRVSECCGLQWHDIDWERQKLHVRRRWYKGAVDIPKTEASATFVALSPVLSKCLAEWHAATPYAKPQDWVFASSKTRGRTPRVGNMLVSDYLRPAAQRSGVFKDGVPRRFGFHNLRKALSDFLTVGKKTDPRTAMDSLRHSSPVITLKDYTSSTLESRIAAQTMMLDAIFGSGKSVGPKDLG